MKTFLLCISFVALIWITNAKSIEEAIKESKRSEGANSSKVLQEELAEVSDTKAAPTRQKRSALPWRKDEFTFSILKYTKDMPARVQEKVFAKAFDIWHEAAPQLKFEFKRNDPKADFKIAFVKGAHGDAQAFDGTGPLIAHVYYPEDGRMHFDDDEW